MSALDPLFPKRDPAHPAARQLELFAFDAPAADEATRSHLASCPGCLQQVQALRDGQAEFLARRPAALFAAHQRQRQGTAAKQRVRAWGFAAALAAACLVGAVTWVSSRPAATGSGDVTLKGPRSVELALWVSRNGAPARPWDRASALRKGDALRFSVASSASCHLLIVSLDAAGKPTRYYPVSGPGSGPLAEGALRVLPGTIELDGYEGEERIFALFSEAPLEEKRAFEALAVELRRAGGLARMEEGRLPWPAASVLFRKAQP